MSGDARAALIKFKLLGEEPGTCASETPDQTPDLPSKSEFAPIHYIYG